MADTATNADTSTAKKTDESTQSADAAKAATNETAPKPITQAELTATLAEFRNSINADIRRANKAEESGKKKAAATGDEDDSERVTVAALKRQIDQDKQSGVEKDKRTNEKIARNAYKDMLVTAGLNPIHAQDIAEGYARKHRDGITILDDDSVHIAEEKDADAKPLSVVAAEFLKTDRGKSYLLPKKTPSVELGKGGKGGGGTGEHPMLKMSPQEIIKHPDFRLRATFKRDHPAEFAEKMNGL